MDGKFLEERGSAIDRRTFLKLASAAAAGLIVQACAPAASSTPGPAAAPAATSAAGPAVAPTVAPTGLAAPARKEVLYGIFTEPKTITHLTRSEITGAQVGQQTHDRLIRQEDPATLKLTPQLATEWKQEDPTTWVFKLREGVKWQKGYGEVTAEDAVWSYQKYLDVRGRPGAMSYYKSSEVRDKYTFAVKLQLPFPGFVTGWAATSYSTIHCKKAFEEMGLERFGREAPGAGPFELEEWKPGVHIKLKKFNDYWNPQLPKVERLTFLFVPDQLVKVEKLRKGELDFIDAPSYGELPALEKNPNFTVTNQLADEWDYICFNLTLPESHPVQQPKVREAIAYALNRNSIVKDVYRDHAIATDLPYVPPFIGYDHPSKYPFGGDPAKARQLLKEAGYPNGFSIECITSNVQECRDELVLVAAQLEDVGIKVKIRNLDAAGYRAATQKQGLLAGQKLEFEMALEDISVSAPDSDACVYWFWHSKEVTYTSYANPEMDAALDSGRTSADPQVRKQAYYKVADLIHRDNAFIYTVFPRLAYCYNSKLEGFRAHRQEYEVRFDEIHWKA